MDENDLIKALNISLFSNQLLSWTIMVVTFAAVATEENIAFSLVTIAAFCKVTTDIIT
jgi:hypothetical protein